MNPRQSFVRKIVYLAGIAVLLFPLYWLGQPGAKDAPSRPYSLAQLRQSYGLSETQFGEMDPTGETVKLATFGMRGIAANILWEKANNYKMKKDWDNLSATLRQITKVEPHFIEVWKFQAWNLSYNVSAEFQDDYRDRFRWVIKGIQYLQDGLRYNEHEPRLAWYVGWFTGQKIGRSDETVQFRRLYKDPDDFYGIHVHDPLISSPRPLDERDNWLVSKAWYERAEDIVDQGGSLKNQSPVCFYSDRTMSQMNYSDALEKDGIFDTKILRAWSKAEREWTDGKGTQQDAPPPDRIPFGIRDIPTTYDGVVIHLFDEENLEKTAGRLRQQLEALKPGLRKRIEAERREALSAEEKRAMAVPLAKRTGPEHKLVNSAEIKLQVSHNDVLKRITGPDHGTARTIVEQLKGAEETARIISRYRQIVNYQYWRLRARIERTAQLRDARKSIYLGEQAFEKGDLVRAKEMFDKGLAHWRHVIDENPEIVEDRTIGDDLYEVIKDYTRLLEKRDEPMPKPFILQDILDHNKNH
jgi:tetratricopeptide (TPR) repeat protein